MRYISLAGTDIRCSALGFGCANLMGRISCKNSLRALNTAFESGITVYDTARSYGWGESEVVLGEFARNRREKIVIVTKCGILPPQRSIWKQVLKPIARVLINYATYFQARAMTAAIRGRIQHHVSSQVQYGQFSIDKIRRSLETSLNALQTDYVDILLLHSPCYEHLSDGSIVTFFEQMVQSGKVRAFGVSTDATNANRITNVYPSLPIVQIENNLLNRQIDALQCRDRIGIMTNAPFASRSLLESLLAICTKAPSDAERWSEVTGNDLRSLDGICQLLLTYALAANPAGVVLCGMSNPDHIVRNVALAARTPPTGAALWESFEEIHRALSNLANTPSSGGMSHRRTE